MENKLHLFLTGTCVFFFFVWHVYIGMLKIQQIFSEDKNIPVNVYVQLLFIYL